MTQASDARWNLIKSVIAQMIPGPGQPKKTTWTLSAQSGLVYYDVQKVIGLIRDDNPQLPLLWNALGYGYSNDPAEVRAYTRMAMRYIATRLRRLHRGVLLPHWAAVPDDEAELSVSLVQAMNDIEAFLVRIAA